jgi:hypothetical protein
MRYLQAKQLRVSTMVVMLAMLVLAAAPTISMAITAPAAGSFAYDVYDIGVNQILKGAIGFLGGVMAIVVGCIMAIRAMILPAIPAIIGGAVLLKADAIVTSLGAII